MLSIWQFNRITVVYKKKLAMDRKHGDVTLQQGVTFVQSTRMIYVMKNRILKKVCMPICVRVYKTKLFVYQERQKTFPDAITVQEV